MAQRGADDVDHDHHAEQQAQHADVHPANDTFHTGHLAQAR